jgi:ABC-type transporter Mla subunit MlaD
MPNAATLRRYEDSVRTAAKTLSSQAKQVGEKIPTSALRACKVADIANQALRDADDSLERIAKQTRALADELGRNAKIAEEYERAMVQHSASMNNYTAAMASYSSTVQAQASAPKGAKVPPPPPHPGGPPTEPVRPSFWSAN